MKETKVELSSSCEFVLTEYDGSVNTSVSVDYTERSPDGYYSDSETSIDINKTEAENIIKLLLKAHPSIKAKS